MAYTLGADDVLKIAGELQLLDDDAWGVILGLVGQIVANDEAWGGATKAKYAATYLAAHFGKLSLVAAGSKPGVLSSGPVSEIHVGPVGKSFASLTSFVGDKDALSASFALTPYGVVFAGLRRTFSFGRFTVT